VTPPWAVAFYESDEDGSPVQTFLEALDLPRRAKVLAVIRLLQEQGPRLPFPYSSQVRGRLRELRAHFGREQYRVLYFGAPGRMFVLLHAFRKRTAQVPDRDITVAEGRMARYLRTQGDPR
jgi:phage-related protein